MSGLRLASTLLAVLCAGCRPPPPSPMEPPRCLLAPELLDFGEVENGRIERRTLQVTNVSHLAKTVQLELADSFFKVEQPHTFELAPGAGANRFVEFRHDDALLHVATIELDAGTDCQSTVQLSGLGQGSVQFLPAVLDFGFLLPGQRKTLELQIVNSRRTPVTLFDVGFNPSSTPAFSTLEPSQFGVPPMTTLPISITAAPPADLGYGALFSARVVDVLVSPATTLRVVGGAPVAQFSETAITVPTAGFALPSFPPTFVDRQVWLRNVTLQGNALEARLRIVPPGFRVESPDGGPVEELTATMHPQLMTGLSPGAQAPLELHFVPSALGPRSFDVRFFTNDPVQPEHVIHFETEVQSLPECRLSVVPEQELRLTRFPAGTTGAITFTNTGSAACVIDDLRLEEPGAFALSNAPTQLSLAAGASHTVTVSGPNRSVTTMSTFGFHVLNANSRRQAITLLDVP